MFRGFNLIEQMPQSKAVIGLNMLQPVGRPRHARRRGSTRCGELIDDGTVRPVVAEAFPFDRAADAHRIIAERRNVGKVVLVP